MGRIRRGSKKWRASERAAARHAGGRAFPSVEPLLEDLGRISLEGISWVIVGGESGPGARRMKEQWVLSLQEQCDEAGIPFFFKQWGGVQKKRMGRELRGRTHDGLPPRTVNPVLPASDRLKHLAGFKSGLVELVAPA